MLLIFTTGILFSHFIGGVLLLLLLLPHTGYVERVRRMISRHSITLAFLTALAGVFGSLFISEIVGYEPCKLCWIQRIFLYPQVVIFAVALWKKEYRVASLSATILSLLGIIVGIYQWISQTFDISFSACAAVGSACNKIYIFQYGYITIPVMSITVFSFILFFLYYGGRK